MSCVQNNVRLASTARTPLPRTSAVDGITRKLIGQGDSHQHSVVKTSRTSCYFQSKNRIQLPAPPIFCRLSSNTQLFVRAQKSQPTEPFWTSHPITQAGSLSNLPAGTKARATCQHLCQFTALASCSSRVLQTRKLLSCSSNKERICFKSRKITSFCCTCSSSMLREGRTRTSVSHLLSTKASWEEGNGNCQKLPESGIQSYLYAMWLCLRLK